MKANRKFRDGEEAVSAVIGVILMVAITVAIAATVYVYVSGIIGPGTGSTPSLSLSVDKNRLNHVAAITVGTITDPNVDWGEVAVIYTCTTNATQMPGSSHYITNTNTGNLAGGQLISVGSCTNGTAYRVTISYNETGGTMGTVTWTQ